MVPGRALLPVGTLQAAAWPQDSPQAGAPRSLVCPVPHGPMPPSAARGLGSPPRVPRPAGLGAQDCVVPQAAGQRAWMRASLAPRPTSTAPGVHWQGQQF